MNPKEDPSADIYQILTEAGLNGSTLLNSHKSWPKIMNEVRTALTMKLKAYIVRRDHEMFNAGAKSKEIKKVEVPND